MKRQAEIMQRGGILLFLLFCLTVKGQVNLVPNWSFEVQDTTGDQDYYCGLIGDNCKYGSISDWHSVTNGVVDQAWYNPCLGNMPLNAAGYQFAENDVSYIGLNIQNAPQFNMFGSDYAQDVFSTALTGGKKYCVKFYVSLADSVWYAVSGFGAYISSSRNCMPIQDTLPFVPQIENPLTNLLSDKVNWVPISGEYLATGGEEYITIGDFYGVNLSKYTYIGNGGVTEKDDSIISGDGSSQSYYFLDAVSVREIIEADAGRDTTICFGGTARIGNDTAIGVSYHWQPATGLSNPNVAQPLAAPSVTTTYTLTVKNDSMQGCQCPDSVSTDSVTVRVDNYFQVTACCDTNIIAGQTVQLSATGGSAYQWSPDNGLSCTSCPNPMASPGQTTTYTVIVTSDSGCSLNQTVTIDVTCGQVFVPNAFSPNNDGQNDILYVRGPCIKTMDFVIFDRWGNKIFESNSINEGWDGKYKDQPENAGTYVYYIKGIYDDGTTFTKKGSIALVR